jgi:hypothetical protein
MNVLFVGTKYWDCQRFLYPPNLVSRRPGSRFFRRFRGSIGAASS